MQNNSMLSTLIRQLQCALTLVHKWCTQTPGQIPNFSDIKHWLMSLKFWSQIWPILRYNNYHTHMSHNLYPTTLLSRINQWWPVWDLNGGVAATTSVDSGPEVNPLSPSRHRRHFTLPLAQTIPEESAWLLFGFVQLWLLLKSAVRSIEEEV